MKTKKPISVKDIAAKAHVSIGTVDRVLHNRGRVSAATEKKIRSIIRTSGYQPNLFASSLSLSRSFVFAVVMPRLDQDCGYFKLHMDGFEKAQRELERYHVRIEYCLFDRYSERSCLNALRKAHALKADGLLIAPVLGTVVERFVASAKPDVPIVFFDSHVPGVRCLTQIVQDAYRSGVLAAHLMRKAIHKSGTVAVAEIMPDDYHIRERLRGFTDTLKGDASLRCRVYRVAGHEGEKEFRRAGKKIVAENNDLRGVFVTNVWTHPFARIIRAEMPNAAVVLLGYDLVKENREELLSGRIDFILGQRPDMQAYEGVLSLFRHLFHREQIGSAIPVPLDILTGDNVEYYQTGILPQ